MVKREGWTSTAARIAQDPAQFGELCGKVGFFAGAQAKAERTSAERAADATPIPKAQRAGTGSRGHAAAATDKKARAALWRGMTTDKAIGAELWQFSAAVQQRFGDDTVRAMLRSGGRAVEAASVPRQHQVALGSVSRTMHTFKEGEYASARQVDAARIAQRQALGYRRGLRP